MTNQLSRHYDVGPARALCLANEKHSFADDVAPSR
jgi:hypothetical protein